MPDMVAEVESAYQDTSLSKVYIHTFYSRKQSFEVEKAFIETKQIFSPSDVVLIKFGRVKDVNYPHKKSR